MMKKNPAPSSTLAYKSWQSMHYRCTDASSPSFIRYGLGAKVVGDAKDGKC